MVIAKIPHQPGWADVHIALAVFREGSLSGAARALGLDPSTVHRRMGRLETELGAPLFERSKTGYAPTPAGEELFALAARMEEELAGLATRIAGRDTRPTGHVRITTSDTLMVSVLTPIFAELREAHPGISLEIVSTAMWLSLSKREADIAVRVSDTPPEHLVGRRVGTIRTAVYGAPGLIRQVTPQEAAGSLDWIGYCGELTHLRAAQWIEANVPPERIVYRVDTVPCARDAAAAGIGIAMLPDVMADGLVRLAPPPAEPFSTDLWLLTHRDLQRTARVRAVMDFLGNALPRALARRTDGTGNE